MTIQKKVPLASKYQTELLKEMCLQVDSMDRPLKPISKRECHLNLKPGVPPPLHRAFSVFLFNEHGQLLLQQRSSEKITFPCVWTNSCCSHPLVPDETNASSPLEGVKKAAIRKLNHELGITQLSSKDLVFINRIKYFAFSDEIWGEHEVDYVLFAQKDSKDFKIVPNSHEVQGVRWLDISDLPVVLESEKLSPWFKLIGHSYLPQAWKSFITAGRNIENLKRDQVLLGDILDLTKK